jgi:hypothetical protein
MTRRPSQLARIEGEREVRAALQGLADAEGVRGLASRVKVSPAMLSRVLLGQAGVTAKLAKVVGYDKAIVFRRRGE